MEIITLDDSDAIRKCSLSNLKENNYLIGSYTKYLNKKPDHDLHKNILIEVEIIYYEKNLLVDENDKSKFT